MFRYFEQYLELILQFQCLLFKIAKENRNARGIKNKMCLKTLEQWYMSRLFWKWGKSIFEKMKIMINIYKM